MYSTTHLRILRTTVFDLSFQRVELKNLSLSNSSTYDRSFYFANEDLIYCKVKNILIKK